MILLGAAGLSCNRDMLFGQKLNGFDLTTSPMWKFRKSVFAVTTRRHRKRARGHQIEWTLKRLVQALHQNRN
ncbi:hypothetical protein RP20_CCG026850 [Aedes albopictus]|nr:hypothetical protein RP20_CCG026850 [Aedes albopictus]